MMTCAKCGEEISPGAVSVVFQARLCGKCVREGTGLEGERMPTVPRGLCPQCGRCVMYSSTCFEEEEPRSLLRRRAVVCPSCKWVGDEVYRLVYEKTVEV